MVFHPTFYGGRRQGGISPSKASENVFLITAPEKGERHGYVYDGPRDDSYFHYTGEGQYGDQLNGMSKSW